MALRISAAILAGGSGKRMGGVPKSAILIGGKTILSGMLETMQDLFEETMIVSGTKDILPGIPEHMFISDIIRDKGPLGGIHAALTSTASDAVFVFAGDMPLISRDIVKRQIERFKSLNPEILVPRTGKLLEPLHCIYKVSVVAALERYINGSKRLAIWDFFNYVEPDYFDLGDSEEIRYSFMNINFPEDIEVAEKIFQLRKNRQ
ncbi:MAG TPA: molybdenum cofactor guanylyltransferase [Bacteroidales bacterium]|nr:molybdenum cofactor guanylyltransferase [Bacteroidales bacterium]